VQAFSPLRLRALQECSRAVFPTRQEIMVSLGWLVGKTAEADKTVELEQSFSRKKAEAQKTVDLEEFLRAAAPSADRERTQAPDTAPGEVPALERVERRNDTSREPRDEPPRAGQAAPSEPPRPGLDERLDEALWETFPASDPIAVSSAQ